MTRFIRPLVVLVLATSILLASAYPLVQRRNAQFAGANTGSSVPVH